MIRALAARTNRGDVNFPTEPEPHLPRLVVSASATRIPFALAAATGSRETLQVPGS